MALWLNILLNIIEINKTTESRSTQRPTRENKYCFKYISLCSSSEFFVALWFVLIKWGKAMSLNDINKLTEKIIGCAIEVHRQLGPGLLESAYQDCLEYEFKINSINYQRETPIPLKYKEIEIDSSFKADFIVENKVIVELKTVGQILPIHEAQLLTYLKLTGKKIGLLINFNTDLLRNGIKRMIL